LPKKFEFLNKLSNSDGTKKKIIENFENFKKMGKIVFEKEDDAKNFYKNINAIFTHQIEDFLENTEETLRKNMYNLSSDVNDKIKDELSSLLDIIKERFDGEIDISLPQLVLEKSEMLNETTLEHSIKEGTSNAKVKGSGFWNSILNRINTNWGLIDKKTDTFTIESKEIEKNIKSNIINLKEDLYAYIEGFYKGKISETIEEKLLSLKEEIEGYRGEQNDIVKKREANKVDIEEEILLAQKLLEKNKKLNKRVFDTKNILLSIGGE
ncbi:MAG: hypothetical protein KAI79_11290, partial [Bacteroidales bacterium]|nr:hypothetical protein [Bacteroidales bacterium]